MATSATTYRSQDIFRPDTTDSLYQCVSRGLLYEVKQCIDNGHDPNIPHPITGLWPIHIAASRGYVDIVQYLYERGCHVDAVDKEGETALLKAAYAGHPSVVRYLIEDTDCDSNHQDRDGWSALHNACSGGNTELVLLLLQDRVDVNMTSNMGHTPLMNAASKGCLDIVLLLLNESNKANPALINKFGETAYDVAAIAGEIYLCYILEHYESIWQSDLVSDPLQVHATIPVMVYEIQQQQEDTSLFGLPFLKQKNRSNSFRSSVWMWNQQLIENRSKVELPNTMWFWLSDWRIDHSYPMLDEEGWSYSKKGSMDTPSSELYWSSEIPQSHSGDIVIRRRRWFRVMKKITNLIPQSSTVDTPQEDIVYPSSSPQLPITGRYPLERSKSQTSVSTTITKTESIFIACSTHTQPLLEEQINNHNIRIPHKSHLNLYQYLHYHHNNNQHNNSRHSNRNSLRIENNSTMYHSSWESNDQVNECRLCDRGFNFIMRRHHCRRCGHIVCDTCSTHRTLLSFSEIIQPPTVALEELYLQSLQLQRICDVCVHDENREVTVNEVHESDNEEEEDVDVFECPVCNKLFRELHTEEEQERHIALCVSNAESDFSTLGGVRYVVYKLTDHSSLIGEECVICFEEFARDDTITRLSCMCSYHRHCINSWFLKGKECPIHSQ